VYIVIVNFKGRCIPQKEPKTGDKEIRDEEMEWWSIGEKIQVLGSGQRIPIVCRI